MDTLSGAEKSKEPKTWIDSLLIFQPDIVQPAHLLTGRFGRSVRHRLNGEGANWIPVEEINLIAANRHLPLPG